MTATARLQDLKQELLPLLKKYAQLKLEQPIQLASGKMSTDYFDGKQITMIADRAVLFARAVLEMVDLDNLDAVGGLTIGADPIASAISIMAYLDKGKNLPAFIVRKEPKKHGLQKSMEGAFLKAGQTVLIVDDVITSGGSTIKAIEAVEAIGVKVGHIICLVDRQEGGGEKLAQKYKYTPLFTRKEIES